MTVHFLNLTNGIEAVQVLDPLPYRFIRIQSTWCEQKRWADILWTLSDDFLMHAALGHRCIVYDYSAKPHEPRALWQGIAWIRYALSRSWHEIVTPPGWTGRARTMRPYFCGQYALLDDRVLARIGYYRQFRSGKPICIETRYGQTSHDNTPGWHAALLKHAEERSQ